ncbi:MAG: hypothetical protein JST82_10100 [Bacteroidetes bacterium]|nr:hypothetical protein [Bacteroidota bacterium]
MNLRVEILKNHPGQQSEWIAGWIDNNAERFAQLMELFLNDEYRVVQRAAWIMNVVVEKNHEIIQPYIQAMIQRMAETGAQVAVKRNVVRVLQFINVPERLHGEVMNNCFIFLANPKETIAVRAFSMTVLEKLSRHYPDIKQELKAVIEDALENEECSAGFINRAQKTLKALTK